MEPIVLTIDMGTQSARALLCDSKGAILAKVQKVYEKPYYSLKPGWAEQSPEFYWGAICECCQKLKREQEALWPRLIAVTVSTIRDTCVCLDENNEPVRDIILWLDTREATSDSVAQPTAALMKLAGALELVKKQRRASKCNWMAEFEPENWKKTKTYALLSTWLNYKFSGRLADAYASTVGHIPFSYKKQAWATPNDLSRGIFDVRDDQLYELVPSGAVLGGITKQAAEQTGVPVGLPLIATGSDKACETLGLGCMDVDQAALSFGTTATIEITTENYVEPSPFMPAYCSIFPGRFLPEVEIYRGYWLISWFKREFAALEQAEAAKSGVSVESLLNKHLQEIPPGCGGLMLHPYFTPGLTKPNARGSLIGFADNHTRMHIYRAIIEGINFALMEGMQQIEKRNKSKVTRLYVAGGGSQSADICQITANMFGLPLYRVHTHEVTGLGSSLVAFVAQKVYGSYQEAVDNMVHYADEFLPDPAQAALYSKLYNDIYAKVYDKLKPFYYEMNELVR